VPPVDLPALVRGAVVAIVISLPLALLSEALVDEDDPSGWAVPLFLAVLIGFVAAGWVAGRGASDSPLVTGALAALAGFVVVQGVGLVVGAADGDDVSWGAVVFSAVMAYGCGLTGAVFGERRRARSSP
jgi:putative membrane protein (TIGR04086 family)